MRLCGIMPKKNGVDIEGLKQPKSDISEQDEDEDY